MAISDVTHSRPAKRRKICSASNESNNDLTQSNNNNSITIIIPNLQDGNRDTINNPPSRREKMETTVTEENIPETTVEKIPEEEIEEFFSVAEKNIQKQFNDKYNFDVAKDVPLEGRYEWVQIKP